MHRLSSWILHSCSILFSTFFVLPPYSLFLLFIFLVFFILSFSLNFFFPSFFSFILLHKFLNIRSHTFLSGSVLEEYTSFKNRTQKQKFSWEFFVPQFIIYQPIFISISFFFLVVLSLSFSFYLSLLSHLLVPWRPFSFDLDFLKNWFHFLSFKGPWRKWFHSFGDTFRMPWILVSFPGSFSSLFPST